MARNRKNDGGTTVIERGSPNDIAERVSSAQAEARRAEAVADVEQFREIVLRIADGHEPDGVTLAAIGDIARRLRLPPDVLTKAVAAVQTERRQLAEVERVKAQLVEVKAAEPELIAELKAARARVQRLEEQLAEYHGVQAGLPFAMQALAGTRGENPLVFADAGNVADRLLSAEAGMAAATIKGMVPRPMVAEGKVSVTAWGG